MLICAAVTQVTATTTIHIPETTSTFSAATAETTLKPDPPHRSTSLRDMPRQPSRTVERYGAIKVREVNDYADEPGGNRHATLPRMSSQWRNEPNFTKASQSGTKQQPDYASLTDLTKPSPECSNTTLAASAQDLANRSQSMTVVSQFSQKEVTTRELPEPREEYVDMTVLGNKPHQTLTITATLRQHQSKTSLQKLAARSETKLSTTGSKSHISGGGGSRNHLNLPTPTIDEGGYAVMAAAIGVREWMTQNTSHKSPCMYVYKHTVDRTGPVGTATVTTV